VEITIIKRRIMVEESNILKEIKRNQKKHDKRERSCLSTEERGQSNLGRR